MDNMELNESEAPLANECRFCCKDIVQVNHSRHAKIRFQVENTSLLLTINIVTVLLLVKYMIIRKIRTS